MKVYALVGESGTGKSHRAQQIAGMKKIECIIDDGLLIRNNRIVAGISAKREKSKIAAIRRAIFMDKSHAEEVRAKINEIQPRSILILGTSDRMIESIISALNLPPVDEVIRIEDVATPEEIEAAKHTRQAEGIHVIPVPTFEVKKQFSGYFIDAVKMFFTDSKNRNRFVEKAVVRPTYSYMGKYTISETAIISIAAHEAESVEGVARVSRVLISNTSDGLKLSLEIIVNYGANIVAVLTKVQAAVRKMVENMTALNVANVDVVAKGLAVKDVKQLEGKH
ncbi:MAG: Asp23/Gls24 family envelope stress response protein [Thermoanaerobacteraceae bacterium]|nr:Asp23/Gls24 family envelope stress response protein [Thermoanaerobacteraceae bacterium]